MSLIIKASESKKRKAYSLDDKYNFIQLHFEEKKTAAEIVKTYGISQSTLSTILSNKKTIIEDYQSGKCPKSKRARAGKFENIENALEEWFKEKVNSQVPINGPILMAKAEHFASLYNEKEFKANTGWLQRFTDRNNITFKTIQGEEEKSIAI